MSAHNTPSENRTDPARSADDVRAMSPSMTASGSDPENVTEAISHARSADFVRRCPSELVGVRCDREDGHAGQHKAKYPGVAGTTMTATWTEKKPRRKGA